MNRPASHETAKPNGRNRSRVLLTLVVTAVFALGAVLLVQANTPEPKMAAPTVRYVWNAPTTGTAVEFYRAEVLVNDREMVYFDSIVGEAVDIPVNFGNKYLVRVAAVDAAGIQGPWSEWSVAYAPELDPPSFNP
mgnify:CR=1 FL=1